MAPCSNFLFGEFHSSINNYISKSLTTNYLVPNSLLKFKFLSDICNFLVAQKFRRVANHNVAHVCWSHCCLKHALTVPVVAPTSIYRGLKAPWKKKLDDASLSPMSYICILVCETCDPCMCHSITENNSLISPRLFALMTGIFLSKEKKKRQASVALADHTSGFLMLAHLAGDEWTSCTYVRAPTPTTWEQ